MIPEFQDKPRQIIPRWRSFYNSRNTGELSSTPHASAQTKSANRPMVRALAELGLDWRAKPSLTSATDFLSACIVSGEIDAAREIAAALVGTADLSPTPRLLALARAVLGKQDGPVETTNAKRLRVRRYPRDPVAWVDLSREHAINGQKSKAERAMRVALSLSKDNRFVLRSASRLYVNIGDFGKANDILAKSRRTPYDPWLKAAEIATATAAGRTSKNLRTARYEVSESRFPARDAAELSAAVATEELSAGSVGRSRKLFKSALIDPTENAVAQAIWADASHKIGVSVTDEHLRQPYAFEALAREAMAARRFKEAVSYMEAWMSDEPFSLQPSDMGLHTSITYSQDANAAIAFAINALRLAPSNYVRHNNKAVAHAMLGEISEAEYHSKQAESLCRPDEEKGVVLCLATRGIIAFRSKDLHKGRYWYTLAIEKAREARLVDYEARARMYLYREEAVFDPTKSGGIASIMENFAKTSESVEFSIMVAEVGRIAQEVNATSPQMSHVESATEGQSSDALGDSLGDFDLHIK